MTNNTSTHDTFAAVPGNRCLRGLRRFWGRFYSFDSRLLAGGLLCVFFFLLHPSSPEQNKKAGGQNGEGQKVFDQRIPLLYQAKGDGFLCGGEKKIAAVFLAVLPLPSSPPVWTQNGVPSIGLWKRQ